MGGTDHARTGGQQARRTLEEHPAHRHAIEHHRAARTGQNVRVAVVELIARRAGGTIVSDRRDKLRFAHAPDPSHVIRPRLAPAQIANQLSRLAEREIESRDPGAGELQESLELLEISESVEAVQAQPVAVEVARGAGDRLGFSRRAGEVEAVDAHGHHTGRLGTI
ncbi:MAG TPA: hypothetical protein VMT24_15900 [Aggregatilineaceae bacterium]|nr:hypothetical protein [Aggregatilineaceae bacterium]